MVTPIYFDLLNAGPPLPGQAVYPANALTYTQDWPSAATLFPQTSLNVGLINAPPWQPSTAYTLGQYVTAGNPNVFATTNRHVYLCTTAGTSGSTEPTWNQTPGGTTADGTGTWTECSLLFGAGTFTGVEPSGGSYARASFDNNSLIFFHDPVTPNPVIQFPTSTAPWQNIVGVFITDGSGNYYAWGFLRQGVSIPTGMAPFITLSGNVGPVQIVQHVTTEVALTTNNTWTISLTGVQPNNTILVLIEHSGTDSSIAIADTGGAFWQRVGNPTALQKGGSVDGEWWEGTSQFGGSLPGGSIALTITEPENIYVGGTAFEVVNAGTIPPVSVVESTGTDSSGNLQFPAMPVAKSGSLVLVGAVKNAGAFTGVSGTGFTYLSLGSTYTYAVAYQTASANTPAGHFTTSLGAANSNLAIVAIVVPGPI